jgi:hypothetical protein
VEAVAITKRQCNEDGTYLFLNPPEKIVDFLVDMIKGGGGVTGPAFWEGPMGDALGGDGVQHRECGVTGSLRAMWSSAEELTDRWCGTLPDTDQVNWAHDIKYVKNGCFYQTYLHVTPASSS